MVQAVSRGDFLRFMSVGTGQYHYRHARDPAEATGSTPVAFACLDWRRTIVSLVVGVLPLLTTRPVCAKITIVRIDPGGGK